jgi:hypothetical protein
VRRFGAAAAGARDVAALAVEADVRAAEVRVVARG